MTRHILATTALLVIACGLVGLAAQLVAVTSW